MNKNHSILPLTKGLLVSMAIRHSHDFNLDSTTQLYFLVGFTNARRCNLINELKEVWYEKFSKSDYVKPEWDGPTITELQLYEEVTGNGYYSPEKEESYASRWPKDFNPPWFD
jgi:hypothetical protein